MTCGIQGNVDETWKPRLQVFRDAKDHTKKVTTKLWDIGYKSVLFHETLQKEMSAKLENLGYKCSERGLKQKQEQQVTKISGRAKAVRAVYLGALSSALQEVL